MTPWLLCLPLAWTAGVVWQLRAERLHGLAHYQWALVLAVLLLLGLGLARRRAHAFAGGAGPSATACARAPWVRTLSGLLFGLGVAVGGFGLAWGSTGWRASLQAEGAMDPALQGQDLRVDLRIDSLPQRRDGVWRFEAVVLAATLGQRPVPAPARIRVTWHSGHGGAAPWRPTAQPPSPSLAPGQIPTAGGAPPAWQLQRQMPSTAQAEPPDLRAGQTWRLVLRLRQPHSEINPHGFDGEAWMWQRGLQASAYVRLGPRQPAPQLLQAAPLWSVDGLRQALSLRIGERLNDDRVAGVLAALVVGDQSAIGAADWAVFRATGVVHLMVISGLHVTLFAWLATGAVSGLWRLAAHHWPGLALRWPRPWAAAWGGWVFACLYAVFSGWGVPTQRTVLMLAVVILLRQSGRRWPWWLVWLWAMLAVLLLDPAALLQAGFWLSFVAVGILFATSLRREPSAQADPDQALTGSASTDPSAARTGWSAVRSWRRLVQRAGPWLRGPAAQWAWALLRQQAVMSLALAPMGLVFFGQFSLVGLLANLLAIPWVGFLVLPLALLGAVLPPLWDLAALPMRLLLGLLEQMAAWPWAALERPAMPWGLALAAMVGALLLVQRLPWTLRSAGLLLLWPALFYQPARPPPGQFEVWALDVGQGSAVLVRTEQHSLLFDTGPRYSAEHNAGERVVLPLLRAMGERLDRVVVSHRDSDHHGGSAAVRAAHPAARWLTSFAATPAERCLAGQRWRWDGVDFEVLHPLPVHFDAAGTGLLSSNAMSCVLRIGNGLQSAWLGGDIDAAQERRLMAERPDQRANWLLAPHHGSKSSSSDALLDGLRPDWIVVQAGFANRFKHPDPKVLARYQARNIAWVETPQCGAAIWRSAQPERMHCERAQRMRYWHRVGAPPDPPAGDSEQPSQAD